MNLYTVINNSLHLPNKVFYPLKNLDFKIYKNFQHKGYFYKDFSREKMEFVDKINTFINLHLDINKIKKKAISENSKTYTIDIFEYFNKDLKLEMYNYFNSPEILKIVNSCLGHSTKLRKICIMYNFFNENTVKDEGPKLFHRDSDSLQDQLKLMILLNDIDKDNGMFYFIPKFLIKEDERFKLHVSRKNMDIWNKWRISDEQVNSLLKTVNFSSKIKNFKGKKREALFVDTSKVYHKGGYIKDFKKHRILLQVTYTPKISLSNWNNNNSKIFRFFQSKLTSLKDKTRKVV